MLMLPLLARGNLHSKQKRRQYLPALAFVFLALELVGVLLDYSACKTAEY